MQGTLPLCLIRGLRLLLFNSPALYRLSYRGIFGLSAKNTQIWSVFRTKQLSYFAKPRIVAKKMQLFEGKRVLLAWGFVSLVSLWKTCLCVCICIEHLTSKWTTHLWRSGTSRNLILALLWKGRGCPESGRLLPLEGSKCQEWIGLITSRREVHLHFLFDDDHQNTARRVLN